MQSASIKPLITAATAILALAVVSSACVNGSAGPEAEFTVLVGDSAISVPTSYDVRVRRPGNVLELTKHGAGGLSKIYVGEGDIFSIVTTDRARQLFGAPKRTEHGATVVLAWDREFVEFAPDLYVSVIKYLDNELVVISRDRDLPGHLAEAINANSISALSGRLEQPANGDATASMERGGSRIVVTVSRSVDAQSIASEAKVGVVFEGGNPVGYKINVEPSPGSILQQLGVRPGDRIEELLRRSATGAVERHTAQSATLFGELAAGGDVTVRVRNKSGVLREIEATISSGAGDSAD